MNRTKRSEEIACWICDYGWMALLVLLVVAAALYFRYTNPSPPEDDPFAFFPSLTPTPAEDTVLTLQPSPTATAVDPADTPVPTPTPEPVKPVYTFVIVGMHWSGTSTEFQDAGGEQMDFFIENSDMDDYFDIQIEYVDEYLTTEPLSSEDLVFAMIRHGQESYPDADRFVGITDGDISLFGDSDVAGWTLGVDFTGVVIETDFIADTAHELGHTYGLCDEYYYPYWEQQNEEFDDGCPNSFPEDCSEDEFCIGTNTDDGLFSIMASARSDGFQDFNTDCYTALQEKFTEMLAE